MIVRGACSGGSRDLGLGVAAAATGAAVAEHFRAKGRDTLVVVDDLEVHKQFWDLSEREIVGLYGTEFDSPGNLAAGLLPSTPDPNPQIVNSSRQPCCLLSLSCLPPPSSFPQCLSLSLCRCPTPLPCLCLLIYKPSPHTRTPPPHTHMPHHLSEAGSQPTRRCGPSIRPSSSAWAT